MSIKLIKACKELNIGMSAAVTFCASLGKEINADPNVRIDDDLYLLLAKEFNKDIKDQRQLLLVLRPKIMIQKWNTQDNAP